MPALRRRVSVSTDPSKTHANNAFGRYKSEPELELRKPVVTSDELNKLRKARDALKLLLPEQALAQIIFHPGLTMFEALELAQKTGKLIVPNSVIDGVLNDGKARFSCWTGTLIVFEQPNQPLGESVTFSWVDDNLVPYSVIFQVPTEFQGRKDCALALEHPDFILVNNGNNNYEIRPVEGAVIHLVESFPVQNGWYAQSNLGIPYGELLNEFSEARYLLRSSDSYIGLMGRKFGSFGGVHRNTNLYDYPSISFGAAFPE